jgi:RNA polymerase sigma factor for flagellar operon FliA
MWEKYQKTKSLAIRNHILSEYLYVVTVNAKRMSALYRNRADLEDIVNQGVIALINCIERYDWTKGVRFDSFASIRVRGAIIDYIRKQDWVPRSMRKKSINIERAYAELQGTLGRPPSDAEVAGSLSMSVKELSDVVAQSCNFAVLSFEELLQDGVPSFREPPSPIRTPEEELQEEEIKDILAMSIDSLGDKERLIVSLYYYEELKLKEIAVALGLTPSRVSQLHARALMKIKKMVGEYINN